MRSFSTGPRRKTFGPFNVAEDYPIGLGVAVLILVAAFVGVEGVLLTESYVETHDADGVVQSVSVVLALAVLSEVMLFLVVFSDPGILPPGTVSSMSHLCPVCFLEIEEFDHHCGFLGACIGKGNFRYFVTFALLVTSLCLTGFVLALDVCVLAAHQENLRGRVAENVWKAPIVVFQVYTKDSVSFFAGLIVILCFYASLFGLTISAVYTYYLLTCRHAIHRRRRHCVGGGCRDVFSGFFRPKLTNPAQVAMYKDIVDAV